MNKEKNIKKNMPPEAQEIKTTITPTLLDAEEMTKTEKRKDLSAIIPEGSSKEEGIVLTSKEVELKTDGAVVLGTFINEDQIEIAEDLVLPSSIDIAKRKEELLKNKNSKKQKKEKKNPEEGKKNQKRQNITSIVALCIILFLGVFFYYYKTHPKEEDFLPLEVHVELGDKLPIRKSAYVKPGVGELTNELSYNVDTSSVIIDVIGEYQFSVWHKGTTKYGKVIVEDTTAPTLEVRDVTITEGTTYEAETFVSECHDMTGCNYSFEDADTKKKYTEPGMYTVFIIAKDAYENKTIKQAKLTIEAIGMVKYFYKTEPFDFTNGYTITTAYDLHFTDFLDSAIILNGTKLTIYEYQDESKYQAEKQKQNGLIGYTFDDSQKRITYKETANVVGNNYSKLQEVTNYLINNGYQER